MSETTTTAKQAKPVKAPRESRYVTVARMAYQVAQASLPLYSHPKSPHRFTLPQLAACVLLSFYLDKSYRDTEEFLLASDKVCEVLELKQVPDHSTLSRAYNKLRQRDLDRMRDVLLAAVQETEEVQEEYVAIDSTHFAPTQASVTYLTRSGRTFKTTFKGYFAVGTKSLYILAVRSSVGTSNDAPFLVSLRRKARHYGLLTPAGTRSQVVLADKGFDSQHVIATDTIPPIRRGGKLVDPERRARADLVSQARLDGLYGKRWLVETVNSVIKRKFGSSIRSRRIRRQLREPYVLALVYNLHVLLCLLRLRLLSPPLAQAA